MLSSIVPKPLKLVVGPLYRGCLSGIDIIKRLGYYRSVIPPRHLRRSGINIQAYVSRGKIQAERCIKYGGLNSKTNMLEIGCGDGRLARTLINVITGGTYTGIEVNLNYVNFLNGEISRKYNNFRFIHADLFHSYYNPAGAQRTVEYLFPFQDESFDFVYLKSVFTHFLPAEQEHYVSEIERVLRKNGVMLATYFIATEESMELDKQGRSEKNVRRGHQNVLNNRFEHHWTRDLNVPEHIVCVDEQWLIQKYREVKLEVYSIIKGTWCGRRKTNDNTSQDVVIVRKPL